MFTRPQVISKIAFTIIGSFLLVLGCRTQDSPQVTGVQEIEGPGSRVITPITRTSRGSVATTTDASSFSTGSYTPSANRILIASVQNTKASSVTAVNSFTGNGLTWNLIQTVVDNAGIRRITQYWAATGASPSAGAATADFNGVTQTSGQIRVDEFDGLNLTNPIGDTDVKNPSGSGTSITFSLTFATAANGTYVAGANSGSGSATPTAVNITQISAVNLNTPSTWLMAGWDAGNQTSPGWTTTSSWDRWGAGFELIAATALHPNEPSGFAQFTERDFAATSEDGWSTTGDSDFSIDTTQTDLIRSTISAGRARYDTNLTPGSGPFTIEKTYTASASIYLDYDIKISSNWYGHDNSGVNKMLFVTGGTSASSPGHLSFKGSGNNPLEFQLRLQDCPPNVGGNDGAGNRPIPIRFLTRGTAYRIEVLLVMNTVDGSGNANADGILNAWVDGVLEVADSGLAFRGNGAAVGANEKWNRVKWNGTYGGTGGSKPPAVQYMWLGYIYGSRN